MPSLSSLLPYMTGYVMSWDQPFLTRVTFGLRTSGPQNCLFSMSSKSFLFVVYSLMVTRPTLGQDESVTSSMDIPILAFQPTMPVDGLTMLADWLNTAESIWAMGYESFRESIEFKPLTPDSAKSAMAFASLEVTKGFGRSSILLFSLFYSYVVLKKGLTDEELEDFRKWPGMI